MRVSEKILELTESRTMLRDLENIISNSENLVKKFTKDLTNKDLTPSQREEVEAKLKNWKDKLKEQKERYAALKASFKK